MNKKENQDLEFYKNGSAEAVLKRFVFSEIEEKLVRDAMRTANMPKPRMALVRQADELLKDVAINRTPISPSEGIDVWNSKNKYIWHTIRHQRQGFGKNLWRNLQFILLVS